MRVCLIPLRIEVRNPSANLRHFAQKLLEVSQYQPDIVCLPECAFTGYLYDEKDLQKFAESIPGQTTSMLSVLARQHHCFICFGMLEKVSEGIYSSAVLIDKLGRIVLVQRKICEHPPFINGSEVEMVETELGCLSILLCGDLFNDEVKAKLDNRLEILLIPLARSFDGKSPDLERWLNGERQAYVNEVRKIGVHGLIVNLLEETSEREASFGGAMLVNASGKILAEATHGTDEDLLYNLLVGHVGSG